MARLVLPRWRHLGHVNPPNVAVRKNHVHAVVVWGLEMIRGIPVAWSIHAPPVEITLKRIYH